MRYLWKFIRRFFKRKVNSGGQVTIDIEQARKEFERLTCAVNKLSAAMSNLESQTEDTRYSLEHMNEEFEKHNQKK